MKFRFLPPAVRELKEAAYFYNGRVPTLGLDFTTEVRSTLKRILANPEAWHLLDHEIRRCRMQRFPYGIIYTIEQGEVLILSVMHLKRHPDSWRKNLR